MKFEFPVYLLLNIIRSEFSFSFFVAFFFTVAGAEGQKQVRI